MDPDDGTGDEPRDVHHLQAIGDARLLELLDRGSLANAVGHRDPLEVEAGDHSRQLRRCILRKVPVRRHRVQASTGHEVVDGLRHLDQARASIEHIVDNDHVLRIGRCIGDNLDLTLPVLVLELVRHHEADLKLVSHLSRALRAASIRRADERLLGLEVGDGLSDECCEVGLGRQLVQRCVRRAESRLRLVVQIDGHEPVRTCSLHEVQQQLWRDGLASFESLILPRIFQRREHDSYPVRRLRLHRIEQDEQLHQREINLGHEVVPGAYHEDVIVGH
mmetsp:Transcript_109128/g.315293  ORF Transcript_109128/g.315293 Transcript_109128/m.315293 type:complete len:277 (+) Transcript_109128:335-1165(+)